MEELKSWLNQILWDQNLSVDEKYNQVINRIPNYLTNTEEKKAVYEKIEWIFHDWLWTYFELIIYDKVNTHFNLSQEESDKSAGVRIHIRYRLFIYNGYLDSPFVQRRKVRPETIPRRPDNSYPLHHIICRFKHPLPLVSRRTLRQET